jgi:hypothetical protein
MARKTKVPKQILGFKLSKGTRKDLKKLIKMLNHPDKHALAVTAASGIAAYLAERLAEYEVAKHGKNAATGTAH